MTRKGYVAVADAIDRLCKKSDGPGDTHAMVYVDSVVDVLVTFFANDNERFDAAKFRAACRKSG